MIPRHIYEQPIGNCPSETWLREISDLEHENGEAVAVVYQGAPFAGTSADSPVAQAGGKAASTTFISKHTLEPLAIV